MPSYSYHLSKSLFLLQSHSLVGGEKNLLLAGIYISEVVPAAAVSIIRCRVLYLWQRA